MQTHIYGYRGVRVLLARPTVAFGLFSWDAGKGKLRSLRQWLVATDARALFIKRHKLSSLSIPLSGGKWSIMAVLVAANPEPATISDRAQPDERTRELGSTGLLDVVQKCLHAKPSEWIFLRELRVGTGFRSSSAQRLDAFALNCFAHTSMRRVCYEVKASRADFFCEMKQPLKRRIGLRYSNEFYFVTPAGLLSTSEIPIECGLVEIGMFSDEQPKSILAQSAAFAHFDPQHGSYCRVTIPAPWRETPGPTWQFVAGMLRNQQRVYQEKPPKPPNQRRLPFVG